MGKYQLVCYTRQTVSEAVYSPHMAYSMHLALADENGKCTELNHNYGVLYAKATQNPENSVLTAKTLDKPWIFAMKDGAYGVIALRCEGDGTPDKEFAGKLLLARTEDFIYYKELADIDLKRDAVIEDAVCVYEEEKSRYRLAWKENGKLFAAYSEDLISFTDAQERNEDEIDLAELLEARRNAAAVAKAEADSAAVVMDTDEKRPRHEREREANEKKDAFVKAYAESVGLSDTPKGMRYRNRIDISAEQATRLLNRFNAPVNVANEVPEKIEVSSWEELNAVKALARYSDGTSIEKKVDWFADGVDWSRPGSYRIKGRVHQNRYEFPMAWHRADPCIGKWKGKYYFIATNDLDWNHTLYIREADTIPGLVTAQESLILDTKTYPHLGNLLWAPEFHIIKDRLYIFHGGTPGEFIKEQSHVMALKEGGNPMVAADWEMPVRIEKMDGSMLYGPEGITLDMTVWEVDGEYYTAWSQRQFSPVDLGAWVYIAKLNPDEPWKLASEPVLLSMPEYSWANNHTFVDEGPFALIRDNKIFLTFSSALVDSTYCVGLLTAEVGTDLLDPKSWVKENYPLMTSGTKEGEYGPGHNAYVEDEDGMIWNTYHARPGIDAPRSSGFRRVHFGPDGYPKLDLTEERDLAPELAWVETEVVVK